MGNVEALVSSAGVRFRWADRGNHELVEKSIDNLFTGMKWHRPIDMVRFVVSPTVGHRESHEEWASCMIAPSEADTAETIEKVNRMVLDAIAEHEHDDLPVSDNYREDTELRVYYKTRTVRIPHVDPQTGDIFEHEVSWTGRD